MDARNGEIEELNQVEDAGVGVRALVGSSWGFFALPDLSDAAARTAGSEGRRDRRRQCVRAGSAAARIPAPVVSGDLVIGVRGRPARGAPVRQGRSVGIASRRRCTRRVPTRPREATTFGTPENGSSRSEGHRIDQHIRECGAGISATVIGDGETQRRSYPSYRGQFGTRGWELIDRARPGRARRADRRRGARRCSTAPRLPGRRHHPDPRQRADGAADPRVGRARDRAGPHPRLGGGVRRYVLAGPRPARIRCGTARS